jgi:SNF2 family DNA or RNA helicase
MRCGGDQSRDWTREFLVHYLKANRIGNASKQKQYRSIYCKQLKFSSTFHKLQFSDWNAFIFRAFIEGIIHLRAARYLIHNFKTADQFQEHDLDRADKSLNVSIITKLQLITLQDWLRSGLLKLNTQGQENGIVASYRALGKDLKTR